MMTSRNQLNASCIGLRVCRLFARALYMFLTIIRRETIRTRLAQLTNQQHDLRRTGF
jgi:hypothetical protein